MLPLILLGFLLLVLTMFAGLVLLGVRTLARRPIRAVAIGAGTGALLALVEDADPVGYAVAGGAVAVALSVTLRSRGRGSPRRVGGGPRVMPVRLPSVPLAPSPAAPLRPAPSLVDIAWDEAAEFTGGDRRTATARADCTALLRGAADAPGEPLLAEWAELIRRRVPELVDAALAAAEESSAPERAVLASDLADALARIGAEADARVGARRRAVRDRFDTLRSYVASRTAPDREWL